jgi:hypothetical protein
MSCDSSLEQYPEFPEVVCGQEGLLQSDWEQLQ